MIQIKNNNPKIYLVYGKAKHGKDTFSAFLKKEYTKNSKKAIITQFGKYIKYYAREIYGWDLSEENKPRELLQQLGTELIRKQLKKDSMFINRMIEDIEIFSYMYDAIIISDVRLKKEITEIKNVFPDAVVIKVYRPDFDNGLTEEQKNHITEVELDTFTGYDELVVNKEIEELEKNADKIYMKIESKV